MLIRFIKEFILRIKGGYKKMFSAVTPEQGKRLENALNVSSYGPKPYNRFSPFSYSPDFRIPVPEQEGVYACSVEGIWQGLKLVNGVPDFLMFDRKPKKREGDVTGHMLNGTTLDIVTARERIYKPSYFFYVENYVPSEIKEDVLEKGLKQDIAFYDIESNLDPDDPSSPLAHSVFLRMFFDEYLKRRLKETKTKVDGEYEKKEFEHETLAEALARVLELFNHTSNINKELINFLLRQNHPDLDGFHQRYYSNLLEKIKL